MTALSGPIVFNNSGSGSDTLASGCGPPTAIAISIQLGAGTNTTMYASWSGTISAGDLVYYNTSTGRKFNVVASATNTGTQSITFDDNWDDSLYGTAYCGGKRATLAGSSELYDQSGSDGDAKAGHILELEDGYTETLSATINLRVPNSGSQGLTIRGALGATTKPVLTFTNNGTGFYCIYSHQLIQNMELKNSSATKTSCIAVNVASYVAMTTLNLLDIHDSTDYWLHGFYCYASGSTGVSVSRCSVGNCSGVGIYPRVCNNNVFVEKCKVFNCTTAGFQNEYGNPVFISNNLFYGNGSYGVYLYSGTGLISGNVFHNNGADSIRTLTTNRLNISNNVISSTTNGINITSTAYESSNIFDSNAFYSCTNNTVNIESATNSITLTADPFVDPTASPPDFNISDSAGGGNTLRSTNYTLGG